MGLDLVAISRQIEGLGTAVRQAAGDRDGKLSQALRLIHEEPADRWQTLSEPRNSRRTVPCPREPIATSVPAPLPPPSFHVVGVDGSQLASDRHHVLSCHVVNIGTASLRYGAPSDASLESRPRVFYRDHDRVIVDPANPERRVRVQGAVLHARRTVVETERVAELAEGFPEGEVGLLLLDNPLVFWGLAAGHFEDFVRDRLLADYTRNLDRVRAANEAGRLVPLAGYTSRPDSSGVVDLLARALCRDPDCRLECGKLGYGRRPCDQLDGLLDREVFASLLVGPGDRSALFTSAFSLAGPAAGAGSGIDPAHLPWFFYLNTGVEIARVEVPAWVAADPARLGLVHALVADQVRRGEGYPVALVEAHEQAIVTGADRDQFWYLIEAALAEARLAPVLSAKGWSKRWRAV